MQKMKELQGIEERMDLSYCNSLTFLPLGQEIIKWAVVRCQILHRSSRQKSQGPARRYENTSGGYQLIDQQGPNCSNCFFSTSSWTLLRTIQIQHDYCYKYLYHTCFSGQMSRVRFGGGIKKVLRLLYTGPSSFWSNQVKILQF